MLKFSSVLLGLSLLVFSGCGDSDEPKKIVQKSTVPTPSSTKVTAVEVIHGHTLPPKPDETLNNSTLLGIDTNGNGVRDDVERWIYHTYTHPIEIGIFMQSARAYQKVIVDPSRAKETTKYLRNASSCEFYWVDRGNSNNEAFSINRYRDLEDEIRGIQFNTVERFMAYKRYNAEFHGEVFGAPPTSKDKCEFDSNGILKDLP